MPVYQYACTECSDQLEVRQSFTDDPLTQCPTCSGRLRKVLSAVGVVFKGSGFYRTDSRAESRTDASSGADKPGVDKGAAAAKESGAQKDGGAASSAASSGATSSGTPSSAAKPATPAAATG